MMLLDYTVGKGWNIKSTDMSGFSFTGNNSIGEISDWVIESLIS